MQRNDEPDGKHQRQCAVALGRDAMLGEGVVNGRLGKDAGAGRDAHRFAERACGVNRAYRESNEVAPVWCLSTFAPESMPQKSPHPVFERYWG